MQNNIIPRNSLKYHAIFLVITGLFCFFCLLLSGLTPRLSFDVGIQATPNGAGVVVKRMPGGEENVQTGDIIEAVSGQPVQTKAALYHQLLSAENPVEMTIRRIGGRFQRPVSASDFINGALPAGVHPSDKPAFIADEQGHYTPLEGVEFDTLRSMVEEKDGPVSVIFRRPEEVLDVSVNLRDSISRTIGASLILLMFALMGLVAWQERRNNARRHLVLSNLVLGLGCIAMMTLGLWNSLLSMPPLLMIGLIGLSLFKAVDLDYHVMCFGHGKKAETWIRIALFAGPLATLIVPLWFCLGEIPVIWGASIAAESELRLEAFIFLPMMWAAAYTLIDAALAAIRHRNRPQMPLQPYEIGLILASLFAIFVFVYLGIDITNAQWFLLAAILVQSLGNAIPCLSSSHSASPVRLDSPIFSTAPIRELLDRAYEILGDDWLIQIVIDRPTPRHIVALAKSDGDTALGGVELNILSDIWRDFLEVFRIEDCPITGEPHDRDPQNPVQGIADKLGIVMALPIADNVAGTLTCLTFLVSSSQMPEHDRLPMIHLSAEQRRKLAEIVEEFMQCAPAMVYQSAEISLDFVGDDIDEIARQYHETASFARSLRNPTLPLDPRVLPHGLLDEDDVDETENPQAETPTRAMDVSCETKQYEDEVQFLRSQVAALYSQQIRGYALSEIEFTRMQQETLDEINELDPPILFIGEPGTGKRMLALAAHQIRNHTAFLTVDAAAVPESIFALDMFGDGTDPGLIVSASGGSLLIQNADHVPQNILSDVFEAIEKLPIKDSVALYLSINVTPESFSVEQYRLNSSVVPATLQQIADAVDAEIVVLDPLRTQDDLDVVANFYCRKQAITANKSVDGFTPEALLALKSYAWPGNFTELHSVVERAVMRCEGALITVADLGRDFVDIADASTKNLALSGTDVFREQVQLMQILNETQQNQIEQLNQRIKQLERELSDSHPETSLDTDESFLDGSFADIEKRLLDKLLDKYHRDPEKAAAELGVNRARFFNKLTKYQLITN